MSKTVFYKEHQKAIEKLSIVDIVKVVDYVNELSTFVEQNNEVLDYLDDIVAPFNDIIDKCRTNEECSNCGCFMFMSDLPEYKYVCVECGEHLK